MTHRRDFLGQLAATAVGLKGGVLSNPAARAVHVDGFDDSWTKRISGEHRFVFEIAQPANGGSVLGQVTGLYDDYHTSLNTSDTDLHVVLVIRHMGIALAFNDTIWAKYASGSANGSKDGILALGKRGVTLLCCNMALMNKVRQYAKDTSQDEKTVEAEVRANLLPGVIPQVNGIYAFNRAMDVGCVMYHAG